MPRRALSIAVSPGVRFLAAAAALTLLAPAATLEAVAAQPSCAGRWDATIEFSGRRPCPGWFELKAGPDGASLLVQPPAGPPGLASAVTCGDGRLAFSCAALGTIAGWFDGDRFEGAGWSGSDSVHVTAVRAPELPDGPVSWGKPEKLFNGATLAGWEYRAGRTAAWRVRDGALVSFGQDDDLVSEKHYMNFKLHLKYCLREFQDSGVHLRGRYEIQLSDRVSDADADNARAGAVYGRLAPLVHAQRAAGRWNTLDVELVGARLTARLNGKLIHGHVRLDGITGDALDSNEGEPGPIMLQGHLGLVMFRDIVVTPAR